MRRRPDSTTFRASDHSPLRAGRATLLASEGQTTPTHYGPPPGSPKSRSSVGPVDFMGPSHIAARNLITGTILTARDEIPLDQPIILLEGQQGIGKSRVVREVYRWLQSQEPDPKYWPELTDDNNFDATSNRNPIANRKILGPSAASFVWPEGALPSFSWWTFNCERMSSGEDMDPVAQSIPNLQQHLVPATLAWKLQAPTSAKLREKRDELLKGVRASFADGSLELLDKALQAADIALPSSGLVLSTAFRASSAAVRAWSTRTEQSRLLQAATPLGGLASKARSDRALAFAALIRSVSGPSIPAVVAVEDAHLMTEEFRKFLDAVSMRDPQRPVIVVLTSRSEIGESLTYARWRQFAEAHGALQRGRLTPLGAGDLGRFVSETAPATSPQTVKRLTDRYSDPLSLQVFLGLRSTRSRISGTRLDLSPQELLGAPASITDLYRDAYRDLDEPVRELLSFLAATLPVAEPSRTLSIDDIRDIAAGAHFAPRSSLSDLVIATRDAHWLVDDQAGVRFREPDLMYVAAAYSGEFIDKDTVLESTRRYLEGQLRDLGLPQELTVLETAGFRLTSWFLQLSQQTQQYDHLAACAQIAGAIRCFKNGRYELALTQYESGDWRSQFRVGSEEFFYASAGNAGAVGMTSSYASAAIAFCQLLRLKRSYDASDSISMLDLRTSHCAWLTQAGRLNLAYRLLCEVDEAWVAHPEEDFARNRLRTRSRLGECLGRMSRYLEAIRLYEELILESTRIFGSKDPFTLESMANLANWLREFGSVEEAIQI